jgi:hypothetical protein
MINAFRGEDMLQAYTQLAMPILVQNPLNRREKQKQRYMHGMRMISGWGGTTPANTEKSRDISLAHAFYGGSGNEAASRIGFDVTHNSGGLEDVSFLSRIFSHTETGYHSDTDLACLFRKFGHIVGDAQGSSKIPVHERVVSHMTDVVTAQVCNERDTLVKRALMLKYPRKGRNLVDKINGSIDKLYRRVAPYQEAQLTEADEAYIRHYYSDEGVLTGREEYLRLVNQIRVMPRYGAVIFSPFVDVTMASRYKMPASCV